MQAVLSREFPRIRNAVFSVITGVAKEEIHTPVVFKRISQIGAFHVKTGVRLIKRCMLILEIIVSCKLAHPLAATRERELLRLLPGFVNVRVIVEVMEYLLVVKRHDLEVPMPSTHEIALDETRITRNPGGRPVRTAARSVATHSTNVMMRTPTAVSPIDGSQRDEPRHHRRMIKVAERGMFRVRPVVRLFGNEFDHTAQQKIAAGSAPATIATTATRKPLPGCGTSRRRFQVGQAWSRERLHAAYWHAQFAFVQTESHPKCPPETPHATANPERSHFR